MIHLQVRPYYRGQVTDIPLTGTAEMALRECNAEDNIVGILITGNAEIHQLNLQYRQMDSPTDVLSFNGDYPDPETGRNYLGDIIISIPKAKKQAAEGRHTLTQEVELLVIHGVLHLCGFDHDTEEHKNKMWAVQADLLDRIDNPLSKYFRRNQG